MIMKKILALLLVLAVASAAGAASVDLNASSTSVNPSDEVTITVVADFAAITYAASFKADGGTAKAVGTVNAGFTASSDDGRLKNSGGYLIIATSGNAALGTSIAAGQSLYTFTYVAPTAAGTYTISSPPTGTASPDWPGTPPPTLTCEVNGSLGEKVTSIGSVAITVVPEPMTIALLGLGGLLLRRRK